MAGFDSFTKCLLHFNGADGATSTTEENGKAVTFYGGAALSTTSPKFGTASLFLDGNGDYISLADSADWYMATGNFTIDFWVKRDGAQSLYDSIIGQYNNSTGGPFLIYFTALSKIEVLLNGVVGVLTSASAIDDLTWTHVALVRSSTTATDLYINGVKAAATYATNYNLTNVAHALTIGNQVGGTAYPRMWIDEVRISKDTARWTADFTPPTSEYTADATTGFLTTNSKFW
jgi:hypothetical protein